MEELKNDIEVKYLKEFELGNTKSSYEQWLKNKISIYACQQPMTESHGLVS